MFKQPFTRRERDALLQKYRQAYDAYNRAMDDAEDDDDSDDDDSDAERLAERYRVAFTEARDEYFARLPRIVMSVCPFCDKPLVRSFDPYGLDGLWWDEDAVARELPTCPHFCVIRGALNFGASKPLAGNFQVRPGPEVPYVIPRLLDFPGMLAVVSQVRMENGYVVYPIAYFAERRPVPEELAANWPRKIYTYTTQLGETGWKADNDIWDFDLLPWLQSGKLRWTAPDSGNDALSTDAPDQCPYLNLKGERQRMVVQGSRFWTAGLPDGEAVQPIDS